MTFIPTLTLYLPIYWKYIPKKLTIYQKGLQRQSRRQGSKLPAFESTQLRKLEDGLVGEKECEALLNLAQVKISTESKG